jgi:hypothetical protein
MNRPSLSEQSDDYAAEAASFRDMRAAVAEDREAAPDEIKRLRETLKTLCNLPRDLDALELRSQVIAIAHEALSNRQK